LNRQVERRMRTARTASAEVRKLFTENERSDKEALIAALEKRLLQGELKPKQRKVLHDYLASKGELDDSEILSAIRLVMSTPEYQLT
jgi:hypothetical protein